MPVSAAAASANAGNGGLARADVAQKQAVHDAGAVCHVGEDLGRRRRVLLVRELEGQRGKKRVHARAHHVVLEGRERPRGSTCWRQTQRELKAEQLVIGESPARPLALAGVELREMHLAEGPAERS